MGSWLSLFKNKNGKAQTEGNKKKQKTLRIVCSDVLLACSCKTHHHAGRDRDSPSTVRVGDNITIAYAQESDGYQPHCVQQVGVLLIVISARGKRGKEGESQRKMVKDLCSRSTAGPVSIEPGKDISLDFESSNKRCLFGKCLLSSHESREKGRERELNEWLKRNKY